MGKKKKSSGWSMSGGNTGSTPVTKPVIVKGQTLNIVQQPATSFSNPTNKQVAKEIGITNFNSGSDMRQVQAEIARRQSAPAAAAPAQSSSGGGGGGSPANNGSYDNITAIYQQQMAEARAREQEMAQRVAEQIQAMQLDMNAQIAATQTAADEQIGYLNDLMMQQAADSARVQDMLGQQLSAAEAAYAEQARAAAALGRAFVPALEPTAATVQLGDQRTTQRDEVNNTLSSLAITSSIGSNANPLAGLQLA